MKSIDSIEKSLEERLSPKNRCIGEQQLQNHDCEKQKISTSKFFRIEFSQSISDKTKEFLKKKLNLILDFPERFGLKIYHSNHLLRFIDRETYESEMGRPIPKNIPLPASYIKKITSINTYKVTIIIPKLIDSAEVVVNITRNIYAKLIGRIFFNEQILSLEFYQQSTIGQNHYTPAIPEILSFFRKTSFSPTSLQSHCEKIARSYQLDNLKHAAEIKQQLTKEWHVKWETQSLSKEDKNTIESVFQELREEFIRNPKQFYESFKKSIKQLNSELNFILPHEFKAYKSFEEKNFIHYIRSVKNKLDEISSLIGFVEELYRLIKQSPGIEDLKDVNLQIRSLMKQMRREKKVVHFYVPNMPQNSDLRSVKNRFPLILLKLLPPQTPLQDWEKEVKKLELNFSESIYSKIYSTLHNLGQWSLFLKELKKGDFIESLEGQRLKKLLNILKFKKTPIETLQSNLGVLLEMSEELSLQNSTKEKPRQLVPIEDLSKAWSYFISSILTLFFYKEFTNFSRLPQEFSSENFLKSILKFVEKQCALGINYFHIIKLLLLIYEKKEVDSLEFIIYSLEKPQNILRYTLHQLMLPKIENENLKDRLKKLPQYRDAWIAAYHNRMLENL